MPRGLNEATFNRNADACEIARHPKCVCGCKGAFHGMRHSAAWRAEAFEQLAQENRAAEQAGTPDLFNERRVQR